LPETIGAFDPSTAHWYLRQSNSSGSPDAGSFAYGAAGWTPVTGDWKGSGSSTVGVVDPSTMTWYLRNENSAGAPDAGTFQYGAPGWVPLSGDWTGSGHDGIGAFDPSTGTFYLRNSASAGAPDFTFQYGEAGWMPVTGDWDGNGTTTVGMVDPSTMTWYLRNENSAGAPDAGTFQYGGVGWTPLTGDWNGDGTTTPGVVDPSGTWYIRNTNSAGAPDLTFSYGAAGWNPVSGRWSAPDTPFVKTPVADQSLSAGGSTSLDLAATFSDANIGDTVVRFDTSSGPVFVELFDQQAPQTVANFLDYVSANSYNNSIFHRSVTGILQGGGFTYQSNPSSLTPIASNGTVQNEVDAVNRSNTAGTIAMAKVPGNANSATSQFFFNLSDNSSTLDTANGGYTVFGRVVSQTDMTTLDTLASIQTQNEGTATALPSSEQGVFFAVPLQNYTGTNFPTDTTAANFALVNGVSIVSQTDHLTYSVVGNTNPAVLTATVTNERLSLQAGQTGTTTLTVQATNKEGHSVVTSFNVTVS
jgi:cyclophilin family peptidyl-prolyl cis-trans isomerase